MSWMFDHKFFGHDTFIVFIECKIEGRWTIQNWANHNDNQPAKILYAEDGENCRIHLIEPDGLRRILHFTKGGTLNMNQNILSYFSQQVDELTIDEKEQSGKGKTRDKL